MAESDALSRAEEALRLLAAAVSAARLYPPGSALTLEGVTRFVTRANALSAYGPLRYAIDPRGVKVGDVRVAATQTHVSALAESLHALQVGQLVIAPGLETDEAAAFVELVNSDPAMVRARGGAKAVLSKAGVRHIAVIEVSLRQSEESGLLGIDLESAPLDEIARELTEAVERRAKGEGEDEVAEAVARLQEATREMAMERAASALMRLDEATRARVLAHALQADASGTRMEGMLSVIARMKPAALARLMKLLAMQANTDPRRISAAMQLPPETAKILALLLTPTPDIAPDFGVPDAVQAARLAEEMRKPADTERITVQVRSAAPTLAAGRALATATAVSRTRLDEETVRAISDVLPDAARAGAFSTVREALRRLSEIAANPAMAAAVQAAHARLVDVDVLRDVCEAPQNEGDAAIAGELIRAAGPIGAEALLDCYVRVGDVQRSLLHPVLRGSSEAVLGVARTKLRQADVKSATGIIRTLAALGDRRAVAVIGDALDSSIDEQVRFAAVTALANMGLTEATQALIRALGHRDTGTQRFVVRELGRIRCAAAVVALTRTFDDVNVLARSYEMRKDIITALAAIGTPDAQKALRRFATRPALGRKGRELKSRAAQAVGERTRGVDAP